MKTRFGVIAVLGMLMLISGVAFGSDHKHKKDYNDNYYRSDRYYSGDRASRTYENPYGECNYNADYPDSDSRYSQRRYDAYDDSSRQGTGSVRSKYYDGYSQDYSDSYNPKSVPSGIIEHIFYGKVEKIIPGNPGKWIIDGKEIYVGADADIIQESGRAVPGAYAAVGGKYFGNTFVAYKIEIGKGANSHSVAARSPYYTGKIEKLPSGGLGTWIVSGREVYVSEGTVLTQAAGKAEVGAQVDVRGDYSGSTYKAKEIEVKTAMPAAKPAKARDAKTGVTDRTKK